MRLKPGATAPDFSVKDIHGQTHTLGDYRGEKLMIAFFRYSGCPFCNLRVHDLTTAWPELESNGLKLLTFWQSTREDILAEVGGQQAPFPMIADPNKAIYRKYGVENHALAPWKMLLKPKQAYQAIRSPYMGFKTKGERDLVPADFLLTPDLRIDQAYYGADIGDHMPLSQIRAWLSVDTRKRQIA